MPIHRALLIFAALFCITGVLPPAAGAHDQASIAQTEIRRSYADGPFGQVHMRHARPAAAQIEHPPLLLFHPSPYSGAFFEPFMQRMATDRLVIAVDTPGYGASARPGEPQTIEALTAAIMVALDTSGLVEGEFDVMGYHTGGLIAAQVALRSEGRVRRLVLPGLPFYVGEERAEALREYAKPSPIDADGAHLLRKWEFANMATPDGLPPEQAQAGFNDMMQSVPHDWWAYYGVFSYQSELVLPQISQPALLVTTGGSLAAETEAAAVLLPGATLVSLPDIKHGMFAIHLDQIERVTRSFLDNE